METDVNPGHRSEVASPVHAVKSASRRRPTSEDQQSNRSASHRDSEQELLFQKAGEGEQAKSVTSKGDGGSMEPDSNAARELPDDCLLSILSHTRTTKARNSFALANKHCKELEAGTRTKLRLGTGLHPATEALGRLADRFSGLTAVHFDYLGWKSSAGAQVGDDALRLLVSRCTALEELSLSFCGFVTDSGMAYLAQCSSLRSLRLNFTPCVTGRGLLSVVLGCSSMESLHVERCMGLRSSEWIEALGSTRSASTSFAQSPFTICTSSAPTSPLHRVLMSPLQGPAIPSQSAKIRTREDPVRASRQSSSSEPDGVLQEGLNLEGTMWQPSSRWLTNDNSCTISSSRRSFESVSLSPGPSPSISPIQAPPSSFMSPLHLPATSVTSSASSRSTLFASPLSPETPPCTSQGTSTSVDPPSPLLLCLTPPTPPAVIIPRRLPVTGVRRLTIAHCRGIGEGDLAKLGRAGWERLEELRFEMDVHPRDVLLPSTAPFEQLAAEVDLRKMRVLSLSQCPRVRGEGLALILNRLCSQKTGTGTGGSLPVTPRQHSPLPVPCAPREAGGGGHGEWGLRELRLVGCPGLNDADVRKILSAFSSTLRLLSLSVVKWLGGTAVSAGQGSNLAGGSNPAGSNLQPHHHNQQHQESTWAVTTASLWYIAEFCQELEELDLICRDDFPSSAALFYGFADAAVADMVMNLPRLKHLRVGRGLHVTDKMIQQLRQEYPHLLLQVV